MSLFHLDFRANCGEKMEEFLKRCFYHSGQYDSQEHFTELDKKLKEHEVLNICSLQISKLENWSLLLLHSGSYPLYFCRLEESQTASFICLSLQIYL